MRYRPRRARGVSLVEAMVALAVMAFGTLSVLGVQTTLRMNGDIAKQRNEAIRIAQAQLEQARAFADLAGYQGIAAEEPVELAPEDSNTVYTLTQSIVDTGGGDTELPRRKTIIVDVQWTDRTGQPQSVQLSSAIQGAVAALAGSLSVPTDNAYTRSPKGRHSLIPHGAMEVGNGKSRFDPPGGGGTGWVFSNTTGYIVQVCSGVGLETCIDINARLLAGYVRFAIDAPPSAADAEVPTSLVPIPTPEVEVVLTHPTASTLACFEGLFNTQTLAYYCAIPVAPPSPSDVASMAYWSGQSRVTGLTLATSVADFNPLAYRVCRYTPYRNTHPVVPTDMRNDEHPLHYVGVKTALVSQNFLVVKAGDGASAFDCPPDDDDSADFINSNTWHHQPAN